MSNAMKAAVFKRQNWKKHEAPLPANLMEVKRYLQAIAEATKPAKRKAR